LTTSYANRARTVQLPCVEDFRMMEATLEKTVLMLVETPGMMAAAETATKPAIKAYSTRSCAWVSAQIRSLHTVFTILDTTRPSSSRSCEHHAKGGPIAH